mmetsp:Transcript_37656/g.104828  ORF Transcript_37656/g.104828 Transcript_37656/m.104828 type:complete len:351 (+) Transcript_37656:327-1379(+)
MATHLQQAGRLEVWHTIVRHLVRDRGQSDVHVEAMGGRSVPDALRELLPEALKGLHAVKHPVEAVVNAMPAAPGRLVDVGLHPREVRRHAIAKGASRFQGDHLPVARRLAGHQALQLDGKIVLQAHIILEDDGHRLLLPRCSNPLHGAQVRRCAADHAADSVHCLVCLLRVELHWDHPVLFQLGVRPRHRHVGARDELRLQPKLREPGGYELLALRVPREVQDVDGDIGLQPLPRGLRLCRGGHHSGTQVVPLAQHRVLQRRHWGHGHWRRHVEAGRLLLRVAPIELCDDIFAALVLHPIPAPILLAWPVRRGGRRGHVLRPLAAAGAGPRLREAEGRGGHRLREDGGVA